MNIPTHIRHIVATLPVEQRILMNNWLQNVGNPRMFVIGQYYYCRECATHLDPDIDDLWDAESTTFKGCAAPPLCRKCGQ